MYTAIAINNSYDDIVYKHEFEDLEEAYEAADEMGLAFYSFVQDHNGLEMTMQDIIDRLYGNKHHIVEVYFKGFHPDYAKCHIWFRCQSNKKIFDTVDITGTDGVVYHGTIVDEKYVDIYPAHMGKTII